jgi:thermostable 8-oxoguanine DNA glycosylase
LSKIFGNKNKVNAIAKIWINCDEYRNGYYELEKEPLHAKLDYLLTLPHIGLITRNHLARNLGEDLAKYDIWIQRLGVKWSGRKDLIKKINNSKLDEAVKKVCDKMFVYLMRETGLPIGYIDLVLWWACKERLIKEVL